MYTVRLTRVPENGSLREEGVHLGLEDLALDGPFDPAGVDVSWDLTRMMQKVFGKVKAKASVHLNCGRCLSDFTQPAEADFMVLFEPRPEGHSPAVEEEVADDTVAYIDGEDLPLGEEIRQELELAVPFAPLCREDCAGLCPRCGANLNQGPCGCPPQGPSGPFAGLNDLLKQ